MGNSPFHPGGTPQKETPVVETTEARVEKLKSSLSRRLQAVEEMENDDEVTSATASVVISSANESEATATTTDSTKTSASVSAESVSGAAGMVNRIGGGGGLNEMTKTLSDLYGAINWDDVAKTSNKNNAAAAVPLATSANNLPYISTNASSLLTSDKSVADTSLLVSSQSPQWNIVDTQRSSNNSKVRCKLLIFIRFIAVAQVG